VLQKSAKIRSDPECPVAHRPDVVDEVVGESLCSCERPELRPVIDADAVRCAKEEKARAILADSPDCIAAQSVLRAIDSERNLLSHHGPGTDNAKHEQLQESSHHATRYDQKR
jgi:hypothetical protein